MLALRLGLLLEPDWQSSFGGKVGPLVGLPARRRVPGEEVEWQFAFVNFD